MMWRGEKRGEDSGDPLATVAPKYNFSSPHPFFCEEKRTNGCGEEK